MPAWSQLPDRPTAQFRFSVWLSLFSISCDGLDRFFFKRTKKKRRKTSFSCLFFVTLKCWTWNRLTTNNKLAGLRPFPVSPCYSRVVNIQVWILSNDFTHETWTFSFVIVISFSESNYKSAWTSPTASQASGKFLFNLLNISMIASALASSLLLYIVRVRIYGREPKSYWQSALLAMVRDRLGFLMVHVHSVYLYTVYT